MLSKNQLKNIRKLTRKKYRQERGLFVAEGKKLVNELLDWGWKADQIYTTVPLPKTPHTIVDLSTLKKLSHMASSSPMLGIFHLPQYNNARIDSDGFSLILDGIADPGNLGTIIRLCDWFGIKNLFCSPNTVDCFNPKVIQSTMGSIARVRCHYIDLVSLIENCDSKVYAATLDGNSHYQESFSSNGLLVMGNESHGISDKLLKKIENRISIPSRNGDLGPESLNVASATAILLSEIFRP